MKRIGFHYFPDTQHFRKDDLKTWLPELTSLDTSWLVLQATPDRAIPEHFIRGLLDAEIEPVLHFNFAPDQTPPVEDLSLLFRVYAKWGTRYVTLFDRPNLRSTWQTTNWAQINLVERFLDIYLPLAECVINSGLVPIYPPLEPGGDYWDTAFLRASIRGIKRRADKYLLKKLVIGVYAWAGEHHLNWGAGGPERWPFVRPYFTPEGEEDQCGFRIFDWYNAYIQSILVEPKPLFLFKLGASSKAYPEFEMDIEANLAIAQLLTGKDVEGLESVPDNVIGSAFWLLSAHPESPHSSRAWYRSGKEPRPVVAALHALTQNKPDQASVAKTGDHPIAHYLLLPNFEGEVPDLHLDVIRPFIKKYRPTIGFSIQEAQCAQRVTVIGGNDSYPDAAINQLRNAGCIVKQIEMDGTDIASLLI